MRNFRISLLAIAVLLMTVSCEDKDAVKPAEKMHDQNDPLLNTALTYFDKEVNGASIEVAKVKDGYIVDGDIFMTEEQLSEYVNHMSGDVKTESNLGAYAWSNRTVYYVFASNFAYRSAMQQAMNIISSQTGTRFVQGTGSGSYIYIFTEGNNVNYSQIGQVGGQQRLSLGRNSVGVAIHELGHAMGLLHEHQRPDRDSYIYVSPQVAWRPNFNKGGYSYGQFDFQSIMIYPSRNMGNGYDMVRRSNNMPFNSNVETGPFRYSSGDIAGLRAVGW